MAAKIQCEDCGKWVLYNPDTDAPHDHSCVEDEDNNGLMALDFDNDE